MNRLLLLLTLLLAVSCLATAQIPRTLSYQGVLTDTLGNPKPDTYYDITFRLYDAQTSGTLLWQEQQTIKVERGLFSAVLGSSNPFPGSMTFDQPYWLSLQVNINPELSPRIPLNPVAYSLHSTRSDTAAFALSVPVQAVVDSARIAGTVPNSAVTSSKILDGTIVANDLANGAVSVTKILDGAVTSAKILDGQVSAVDMADEAGVTHVATQASSFRALSSTAAALDSITLTAPAAGYAIVTATLNVSISHTNGTEDFGAFQIGLTPRVTNSSQNWSGLRVPAAYPTFTHLYCPISMTRVYSVSQGSTTFFLNGYIGLGYDANDRWFGPGMTVLYVPTAYGSVSPGVETGETNGVPTTIGTDR